MTGVCVGDDRKPVVAVAVATIEEAEVVSDRAKMLATCQGPPANARQFDQEFLEHLSS